MAQEDRAQPSHRGAARRQSGVRASNRPLSEPRLPFPGGARGAASASDLAHAAQPHSRHPPGQPRASPEAPPPAGARAHTPAAPSPARAPARARARAPAPPPPPPPRRTARSRTRARAAWPPALGARGLGSRSSASRRPARADAGRWAGGGRRPRGARREGGAARRGAAGGGGAGLGAGARAGAMDADAEPGAPGLTAEDGARAPAEFAALHGPALRASGVPERYWGRLLHKLEHEVFDAGEMFGIMQVEEVEEESEGEEAREVRKKKPNPGGGGGGELCYKVIVTSENGLQAADPNSIFLIDHAWTCRVEHARQQLHQVPGLLHRMANLMGVEFHGELPSAEAVDLVLEEMWRFNQTYQLAHGTAEEKVPVWYIMDEFGSRIQHSDTPSFATAPFFYMPQQVAYTLLWPLRDLDTGEEVTRDFAYGEADPLIRKCMLLPWVPADMLDFSSSTPEPPDEHYQAILEENKEKLPLAISPVAYPRDHVFKVYTDIQQVLSHLSHPRFTFTQSEADADILYNFSHFKDYRRLSQERPNVLLNQFPCENLLTVKDCLASIARRAGGPEGPAWLPRTFNLRTELPQFVSYFQQRERRGQDNHWICKPWNLARSLDTHITRSLHSIIRHRESTPKVVSKYIESPVLFLREDVGPVKFDVRYVVLLRSVKPLTLFVYDVFWLRFSNRPFALDDLDDYEKHFTVMNYDPEVVLKQVHYDEFIPEFEKQYPEFPWKSVQGEIFQAFTELFQVACAKPPPLGLCDYPSSRAVYAVDLMLKWDNRPDGKRVMQPQILEVNFNPDCERACRCPWTSASGHQMPSKKGIKQGPHHL
uniref:Tubulin--tyrosine ligase-like protein 12 SET-like domain-containing protein n=1 Tax=Canis lupus familiaris TaxID=9615 RepID=A0A8C0SHF7_CANLF